MLIFSIEGIMLYVRRHGTELYYRYVLSTPLTPLKVVNILASLSIEAHFKKSYGGHGLLNAYLVGHAVEKRIRTKSSSPPTPRVFEAIKVLLQVWLNVALVNMKKRVYNCLLINTC